MQVYGRGNPGDSLEMTEGLLVTALGHQGEGRLEDGRFVPRVLPGERVEIAANGAARVLAPSAERVSAPCRHYKACGGCSLQHANDPFVAEWKQEVVASALRGRHIEAEIEGIRTSPPQSRRRAKFSATRTKKGAIVGLHGRASGTIHAVPDCRLMTPKILAALSSLELLTARIASRREEIGITLTDTDAGLDVAVEAGSEGRTHFEAISEIARQADFSRISVNGEVIAQRRPPIVLFDGIAVTPPSGAFLQATEDGEAALREVVHRNVDGARRIIDLFSGCGTFSLPLARYAQVHAVESETEMLDALEAGWRRSEGLKQVTVERRDLFRRPVRVDELEKYHAVVIDPPRAGAEAQVAELAQSRVPRIAMVSCNPVTFARDAETLIKGGYQIGPIRVVDQFRWSSHVEIAAGFTR